MAWTRMLRCFHLGSLSSLCWSIGCDRLCLGCAGGEEDQDVHGVTICRWRPEACVGLSQGYSIRPQMGCVILSIRNIKAGPRLPLDQRN